MKEADNMMTENIQKQFISILQTNKLDDNKIKQAVSKVNEVITSKIAFLSIEYNNIILKTIYGEIYILNANTGILNKSTYFIRETVDENIIEDINPSIEEEV